MMSHVGGDALRHGDGNRWTDNNIGPEGGEPNTIDPTPGGTRSKMTIIGRKDDRVIQTKPLDRLGQYKFVIAEAMMARLTKQRDRPYSDKCLEAAKRCYQWCATRRPEQAAETLGGRWRLPSNSTRHGTGEVQERGYRLCLPAGAASDDRALGRERTCAWFLSPDSGQSGAVSRHLQRLLASVRAVRPRGTVSRPRRGRQLAQGHSAVHRDYLAAMSKRNSFGIVPHGFFTQADPGGNRKIGNYWYRYFMSPNSIGGWASTRTSPRRGSGW